jgi:hypothetical protein
LELKISIEEKKGVINIEKYVENKLHIRIFGIWIAIFKKNGSWTVAFRHDT